MDPVVEAARNHGIAVAAAPVLDAPGVVGERHRPQGEVPVVGTGDAHFIQARLGEDRGLRPDAEGPRELAGHAQFHGLLVGGDIGIVRVILTVQTNGLAQTDAAIDQTIDRFSAAARNNEGGVELAGRLILDHIAGSGFKGVVQYQAVREGQTLGRSSRLRRLLVTTQ